MAIELVIALAVVLVIAMWALLTAQRLNSLHIRTDAALAQLEATLDRRAAVISALAPELQHLAARAESTDLTQGNFDERTTRERELSAAIAQRFETRPALLADAPISTSSHHSCASWAPGTSAKGARSVRPALPSATTMVSAAGSGWPIASRLPRTLSCGTLCST